MRLAEVRRVRVSVLIYQKLRRNELQARVSHVFERKIDIYFESIMEWQTTSYDYEYALVIHVFKSSAFPASVLQLDTSTVDTNGPRDSIYIYICLVPYANIFIPYFWTTFFFVTNFT